MKVLTLCIPCYHDTVNVHSIVESCLIKQTEIQMLFVTNQISESLQEDLCLLKKHYPDMIDVCESSDNTMCYAKGLYFKLMHPCQTLDQSGLVKVITTLQDFIRIQANLDLLVCDIEYRTKKKKKDIVEYKNLFPVDTPFEWHQLGRIKSSQCIVLESCVFKTNTLKENRSTLTNTIYMSYASPLLPMVNVKTLVYIDQVLVKTNRPCDKDMFDQVAMGVVLIKAVIDKLDISEIKSRKLKKTITEHFVSYLSHLLFTYIQDGSVESLQCKEELWYYLKVNNYILYKQCKRTLVAKVLASDNEVVLNTVKKRLERNK
ncbi:hypothetical protein [Tannockella kyphosi]|uniref:hypothetical protein n=1 Tax=Tannockella kyphosi TaxID=2899121 RepID=UPI0020119E25|nr:hypothetical protein [Tannockella kyphosi]